MKLVFICPTSYVKPYNGHSDKTMSMGASWSSVIDLTRSLAAMGHDVIVLNHCDKPGVYDGVKYLTTQIPEGISSVKDQLVGLDAMVINRAGSKEWHDVLEKFAGLKDGYKKILLCHDSGGAEKGDPEHFSKYDRVVSVSQWLNQINIKANDEISSDYFVSIPLGVDTGLFAPVENANRFRVVFTGAFVSARRPQLVYEAFARVCQIAPQFPWELHMIGSASVWGGPPRGADDQATKSLWAQIDAAKAKCDSKKVFEYGDIPREKIAELLPTMGVSVYPTYTETCGVSIMEAQSAGVPVIIPEDSMHSAVSERIYHTETGVVRNFGRIDDIALAIIDTATNNHAYDKIRKNAREKVVRENNWMHIATRWVNEIFNGDTAKQIIDRREGIKKELIGIGVLSYQNTPLLKECITSLVNSTKNLNVKIVVWDNNSKGYNDKNGKPWGNVDFVRQTFPQIHVIESPQNVGCTKSRNGVFEYFRDNYPEIKYVLFSDMDVIFKQGFLEPMLDIMAKYPDAGIVGYPEANLCFRPSPDGRVTEIMSICNLHRLASFESFDLDPPIPQFSIDDTGAPQPTSKRPFYEAFFVYSFDSWVCQTLNTRGWYTYVTLGRKGYNHVGGQIGQFLSKSEEIKSKDVKIWQKIAGSLSRLKNWETKIESDYIEIGNDLKANGKYTEALNEYLEGVSRFPDHGVLQLCLGNLYKDTKEYDKAIQSYKTAIQRDPGNIELAYALHEAQIMKLGVNLQRRN